MARRKARAHPALNTAHIRPHALSRSPRANEPLWPAEPPFGHYRTNRYKLVAFVMSASLSGLAGALKALVAQNALLTDVHWTTWGEVVLMTLVGAWDDFRSCGRRFRRCGYAAVSRVFRIIGTGDSGFIFVVCVRTFRRGIIGEIGHALRQFLWSLHRPKPPRTAVFSLIKRLGRGLSLTAEAGRPTFVASACRNRCSAPLFRASDARQASARREASNLRGGGSWRPW